MRVVVVGGGIGGLAAAVALRRAGHEAVVLERAERLAPVGAGISLFSNAMRALERLGVAHAVAARGSRARRSAVLTDRGRTLAEVPRDLLEGAVAVHRADLQAVLASAAEAVQVRADVVAVEQEGSAVIARRADGGEEAGDLLVGADGLRSLVRGAIATATPRYAGYTAWRGIAPVTVEDGRWTESWGAGERFGLLDIGRGRTYWFATKNAPEGERDETGGRKAELVRRFGGWHEPIAAVIEATDEETILRNDVYDLEPLQRWSVGRIVLLGDAAHATTPAIGQGAAQAIEDAVVLAETLSAGAEVDQALRDYEARRRPRAQLVLKLSRRADRAAQLGGGLPSRLRNVVVRALPASLQRRQLEPVVAREP